MHENVEFYNTPHRIFSPAEWFSFSHARGVNWSHLTERLLLASKGFSTILRRSGRFQGFDKHTQV